MIYTLTLNPSLDYLLDTPDFKFGKTNRSVSESLHFGGKGINVSYVLKQLGIQSICLGFTAGFTGDELEKMLMSNGLTCDFVKVEKGNTRINVKIRNEEITEINAQGPEISSQDVEKLFKKLETLSDGDTLVLAGSTPKGHDGIYCDIMKHLSNKSVRFVVDCSGQKLLDCLKYKPFLIKPNKDELSEIVGQSLENDQTIVTAAGKLKEMGAVNVLVSLGGNGALLVDENNQVHRVNAYRITPVSTVGAGDSMVAGFLAGAEQGYDFALKLGNACGAASAASAVLAKKEKINEFLYL